MNDLKRHESDGFGRGESYRTNEKAMIGDSTRAPPASPSKTFSVACGELARSCAFYGALFGVKFVCHASGVMAAAELPKASFELVETSANDLLICQPATIEIVGLGVSSPEVRARLNELPYGIVIEDGGVLHDPDGRRVRILGWA